MMEVLKNTLYKVLTPTGFEDFDGLKKVTRSNWYALSLANGYNLTATPDHKLFSSGSIYVVEDLIVKTNIDIINNSAEAVVEIKRETTSKDFYDLINVDSHKYFANNIVVSNCDCDFTTSGATVVEPELLAFMKATWIQDPIEKRFPDQSLWIWEPCNYQKDYIVVADVARGDGSDYSACHVIDVETAEQVAEFKAQVGTTEFGHILVNLAVEYNNAMLVIENANIGWATCQTVIDRHYPNLYYSFKDINYVDQSTLGKNFDLRDKANMVPGFTTSIRSRPLIIGRMELYFRERECRYKSVRMYNELLNFVWKSGKAQSQQGYNDDLVMAWAIGLWTRDHAIKLRQQGISLNKSAISNLTMTKAAPQIITTSLQQANPWKMRLPNNSNTHENLDWLL